MSCCEGHHRQGHHHGNHHRHRGSYHGDCECGNHHGEGCSCREHHRSADCCCGERRHHREGHFHRRYFTREEKIAELEGYLEDLQAEIQAVEERLADLKEEA
ncbi:MAG: hypothetical protein R6U51_05020 [Anaerolineales bacterium]